MTKKSDLKNKATYANFKKTWHYLKPHKKLVIAYLIVSIITASFSIVVPILSARIVLNLSDELFRPLIISAFTIFGIEIIRNIFNYFSELITQNVNIDSLTEIQIDLAEETLKLETKEIDHYSSGILIDRLNKDSGDISRIFNNITRDMINVLSKVGVLIAILIVNKVIFGFTIAIIAVSFLFEQARMKKFFQIQREWRKISELNSGLLAESIRGIRDIKVLNTSQNFMNKVKNNLTKSNSKLKKMLSVNNNYRLLGGSIRDICDLLFIVLGAYLWKNNMLATSSFLILYYYQGHAQGLMTFVIAVVEQVKNFNVSAERVFELLDSPKFTKETFGTTKLTKFKNQIAFNNVDFSYNDKNQILKNINFEINKNETIAFVGKSGAGKSTIFNLLTKMYLPTSGTISIDHHPLNELDRSSIRDNISIITQAPYIFNFTIKDNLRLVKPKASQKEIEEVCKIAHLHEFIQTLPDKYNTLVGEGGVTLSGGQKQRLAIARTLLKNSDVILFDEATSALDNETQQGIKEALVQMKGNYTILIIAHRLSTVIDADRIILMDKGQIIAAGSHHELMESNEFYQKLYTKELQ